jgi:two-component system, OmpR family, phosphate regulon response regulator PhoB
MNKKVLLVEDDATMRGLLKTLLELEGFSILTSDGTDENLLKEIEQFQPHFIMIDYHLMRLSGLDLLYKLRADNQLHSPFILMISGEDRKKQCIESGADGFLLKPFMPEELINWLHERE